MSEPDRLVETHSAHVLLVADRVFKWKKPLDLGFVDFRSLAARERACAEEVTLNRRLAPDVYLGVDVLRRADGSVREHVVVMRRLPDAARLSRHVRTGQELRHHVHALARLIAAFHAACARTPRPLDVAGPERLRELWDTGLDALTAAGELIDQHQVTETRELVHDYLVGRGPLLVERIARGHVRDGHGDLLADDIFCLPDGPRVLDCLDFDPALRHGDVLADVATLVLDLERLGSTAAAEQLLREYGEFSGEHHPDTLAHLYLAYRAQVRAKVALLRCTQSSDPEVRDEQLRQARQLVGLMVEHARRTLVVLTLVGGLPGSGKSTVADGLSQGTGSLVFSSDLARRERRTAVEVRYSAEAVDQVYELLLDRARAALEQGWDVVLDASWTSARHRRLAVELAAQSRSALVELHCHAPDSLARERLAARPGDHPSEAGADVRALLAAHEDPWPGAEEVATDGPAEDAVAHAVRVRRAAGGRDRPARAGR